MRCTPATADRRHRRVAVWKAQPQERSRLSTPQCSAPARWLLCPQMMQPVFASTGAGERGQHRSARKNRGASTLRLRIPVEIKETLGQRCIERHGWRECQRIVCNNPGRASGLARQSNTAQYSPSSRLTGAAHSPPSLLHRLFPSGSLLKGRSQLDSKSS